MKNIKRILALLLALIMIGSCFVACGDPEETPDDPDTGDGVEEGDDGTEEGDGTVVEQIKPDIPETYNFNDEEISFLYWYVEAWVDTVRHCRDIYFESPRGEPIPDKVYYRNAEIEENYNVKITLEMSRHDQIGTIITNQNATGDTTYLITIPRLLEQAKMVTSGAFQNLYDVEHIDLDKPWWDQDSIAQLSSNGTLNLVGTSLMVNDKDATAALAFNKDAAADKSLGSLYTYLDDNEWTYETLISIAEDVNEDSNGDEKMDMEDFWGFLGKNDVMTSFFHGSGGQFVTKDPDEDEFVFSFGTENDINATMDLLDYVFAADWFFNHHMEGIDDTAYTKMFESGHGLFFWMRLDEVTNMRGSETNFGILPIPKYTEEQENYYATVSQHTTGLLSIPMSTTGEDLSMVGMILEALSAHSHYNLQPEYVEVSLKTRYARDDESEASLDIILNSRVFDPGVIFGFGSFADDYQSMYAGGHRNISSFVEERQSSTEEAIAEFNDTIFENAN